MSSSTSEPTTRSISIIISSSDSLSPNERGRGVLRRERRVNAWRPKRLQQRGGEVVRPTGDDPPLGHQALKSLNAEGLGVCEVREKGSSAVPLGTPFALTCFSIMGCVARCMQMRLGSSPARGAIFFEYGKAVGIWQVGGPAFFSCL